MTKIVTSSLAYSKKLKELGSPVSKIFKKKLTTLYSRMDPYEYHELHDRWDALMVKMLRLFSKLNLRIQEDSCSIDDR